MAREQSAKADRAGANKSAKARKSRDPPPPPELAPLEETIVELASEYSVLISLWPPKRAWASVTLQRPDVDPYDPATRYPGSADGAVRVRSRRGREALADPTLQTAVIAELHDFFGKLAVHLPNKWV